MQILIWAGMFLFVTVLSATLGIVGMIGLPIATAVQVGVFAMATLVVGSGIVLMHASPPAASTPLNGMMRDPTALT